MARALATGCKSGQRLSEEFLDDLDGALLSRDKTYALTRHQRTGFDIAVNDRTPERASPKVLDLELCRLLRQFPSCEPIDNPPLHALQTGVSGGNGVYLSKSTPAFPTVTFNASNYWVDVVFTTTSP